jgi:hypothetical protein
MQMGMDVKFQMFLTFALDVRKVWASSSGRFTPLWIWGSVEPTVSLDVVVKKKNSLPLLLLGLRLPNSFIFQLFFCLDHEFNWVIYFHQSSLDYYCVLSIFLERCVACLNSTAVSEATCFFEASVDLQWIARLRIPYDRDMPNHRRENFRLY